MTDDLTRQSAYLRDQFAVLTAKVPVPVPTAQELADGAAADKVTAQRIHCARPGVPLHHVFAVLQALRAVRALDRAPNPDHEDRISLDDLTSDDLDLLYDDLDRYAEVVGELNETLVQRTKETEEARSDARSLGAEVVRWADLAKRHQQWGQRRWNAWKSARRRAARAGAAIARVQAVAEEYPAGIDTALIHAALDDSTEG